MNVLDSVVQEYIKSDIPAFGVGDTVKAVSYTHLAHGKGQEGRPARQ